MASEHFHNILTINSGSSSIKFSLYRMGSVETAVLSGTIGGISRGSAIFHVKDGDGRTVLESHLQPRDHGAALREIIKWLKNSPAAQHFDSVGHRLVHGGNRFSSPHLVTPDMMEVLDELMPLAPDHLPHEINAIKVFEGSYPDIKQVACFDTAFHRSMPGIAQTKEEGIMAKSPVSQRSISEGPLSAEELRKIDAYWRATLYLCVGMIFLKDNPLMREPLKIEHIKKRLLGHWGSDPGQTFTWVHMNLLEEWMKSYRPKELFDGNGKLIPELKELAPPALAA